MSVIVVNLIKFLQRKKALEEMFHLGLGVVVYAVIHRSW